MLRIAEGHGIRGGGSAHRDYRPQLLLRRGRERLGQSDLAAGQAATRLRDGAEDHEPAACPLAQQQHLSTTGLSRLAAGCARHRRPSSGHRVRGGASVTGFCTSALRSFIARLVQFTMCNDSNTARFFVFFLGGGSPHRVQPGGGRLCGVVRLAAERVE